MPYIKGRVNKKIKLHMHTDENSNISKESTNKSNYVRMGEEWVNVSLSHSHKCDKSTF